MMRMSLSRVSFLFFVMTLVAVLKINAATVDIQAIKVGLEPIDAVLVMPMGEEWLIDADAKRGVYPGDYFSVIETGRPILHPVTKEVLGYLEQTRSVLQITKIKSGYSYAAVVKEDGELKPGMNVRRFSGLTARMQDDKGDGRVLYGQLQTALPHLEWLNFSTDDGQTSAVQTDLLFHYDAKGLTVSAADNTPLRYFGSQTSTSASLTSGGVVSTSYLQGGGVAISRQNAMESGAIIRSQAASQSGIWRSSPFRDTAVGMVVANFVDDESLEVAVLTSSSIGIVRLVDGEYKQVAHYDLPNVLTALALDAADLDANGYAEIYLTGARDHQVESSVLEVKGRTLEVVAESLPYYFRNTSIAGQGQVLLGQRGGDQERPFVGPVFKVQRNGSDIIAGEPLNIPGKTNVFSFVSLGNGLVARIKELSIVVSSSIGDLWEGSSINGGSEVFIDFIDKQSRDDTMPFFIPPRLAEGENEDVVLATEHKENLLSHRFQTYEQGRVVAYQWNGTSMQEVWHTLPQAGYLADFSYADADNDGDKEIVAFYTLSRQGLLDFSGGRSALMIFELN